MSSLVDSPKIAAKATPELKAATTSEKADGTPRAIDPAHLGGKADNNGALMGVAGAKYIEQKPAQEFDEKGILVKLDANGNPVKKADGLAGITGVTGGSEKAGAGDSYKAMARKLEAQRQAQRIEAERHEAILLKSQIVEDRIRKGIATTEDYEQLEKINRRILDLPPDHTGY